MPSRLNALAQPPKQKTHTESGAATKFRDDVDKVAAVIAGT